MTSHLHNPVLRLVSLNPELSLTVSFLRVPEIHDGYEYKIYLHPNMVVKQVIDLVIEELGLTKSLPVPGGGALEYVLEETWIDGQQDRNYSYTCLDSQPANLHAGGSRLPPSASMFTITRSAFCPNPFSSQASRIFRFCVPDEWYRRSKSRAVSSASVEPSESTLRRLAALQESDEEEMDEGDGTAKVSDNATTQSPSTPSHQGTFSQNRLSHIFDGWLAPTSPTSSPTPTEKRRTIVSEPKPLDKRATKDARAQVSDTSESEESDVDSGDFEQMLVLSSSLFESYT